MNLDEAQAILSIKLPRGRPSAEITAKRAEAKRIVATSHIAIVRKITYDVVDGEASVTKIEEKTEEVTDFAAAPAPISQENLILLGRLQHEAEQLWDRYWVGKTTPEEIEIFKSKCRNAPDEIAVSAIFCMVPYHPSKIEW